MLLTHHRQTPPDHTVAVLALGGCRHTRHALVRHALEEAHVKAQLVPLDGGAFDLDERQADRGLPVLRRLQDEVVERISNFRVAAIVGI